MVNKEKLIFNSDLSDIKSQNKITLNFRENKSEEFNYLIAADGVFSKTKQILFKNSTFELHLY